MNASQLKLFSALPESLSPREKWIRANQISIAEASAPGFEDDPWIAWVGGLETMRYPETIASMELGGTLATGPTRDVVLDRLAHSLYMTQDLVPWSPWIASPELSIESL